MVPWDKAAAVVAFVMAAVAAAADVGCGKFGSVVVSSKSKLTSGPSEVIGSAAGSG